MSLTTDPNDPGLEQTLREGDDLRAAYLVLSDEERAKGFVRPVIRSYVHVGRPGPVAELLDLTPEQQEAWGNTGAVKFEPDTSDDPVRVGRLWSQDMLDRIDRGCGAVTTMSQAIAETYAREPSFYGSTYCVGCRTHLPVGPDGEFVWVPPRGERLPTDRVRVGS